VDKALLPGFEDSDFHGLILGENLIRPFMFQ